MYKNAILKFTVEIPSSFPDGVCPVSRLVPALLLGETILDGSL